MLKNRTNILEMVPKKNRTQHFRQPCRKKTTKRKQIKDED